MSWWSPMPQDFTGQWVGNFNCQSRMNPHISSFVRRYLCFFINVIYVHINCSQTKARPIFILLLKRKREYQSQKANGINSILLTVKTNHRYRLGDIVKVVGFHNQCPIMEFQYRYTNHIHPHTHADTHTRTQTHTHARRETETQPFSIGTFGRG